MTDFREGGLSASPIREQPQKRPTLNRVNRGSYQGRFDKANSFRNSNSVSYNSNFNRKSRKTNPANKDGEITRCNDCGSIYQRTKSCPGSNEYQQNPKHNQEVRLALYEDNVKTLLGESLMLKYLFILVAQDIIVYR